MLQLPTQVSFKKRGKNKNGDAKTVEGFISGLGSETQKFLKEVDEGKSGIAQMKTTQHLGPNFGKPGYKKPQSPTKKPKLDSKKPKSDSPAKSREVSPIKDPTGSQDSRTKKPGSPSKRPKPESPVKREKVPRELYKVPSDNSLATSPRSSPVMMRRMQLPLVSRKKGDPKEDTTDPESFYREFRVRKEGIGDPWFLMHIQKGEHQVGKKMLPS